MGGVRIARMGSDVTLRYRNPIELSTEVTVLWGDPGTKQKEIRATVSRFPYLHENRNEQVDVSTIPCRAPGKK